MIIFFAVAVVWFLIFHHGIFFFGFTVLDSAQIQNNVSVHKNFGFFCTFVYDKPVWLDATFFFSIVEIGRKTTWKNGRWIVKSFLFYEIIVVVSIWFHCVRFRLSYHRRLSSHRQNYDDDDAYRFCLVFIVEYHC